MKFIDQQHSFKWLVLWTLVLAGIAWTHIGCTPANKPGDLARVQPYSDGRRVGNVYALRGFLGIWSVGMDETCRNLNSSGVRATAYQDNQWDGIAQQIRQRYADAPEHEPLILMGHSFGADNAISIARELKDLNIGVDLLVTVDPVNPAEVPSNVRWCLNIYQSNGLWDVMPMFRGIRVKAEDPRGSVLDNFDVRKDRTDLLEANTDHFNIDKNPKVQEEICKQVISICPMREIWVKAHVPATAPAAPASR